MYFLLFPYLSCFLQSQKCRFPPVSIPFSSSSFLIFSTPSRFSPGSLPLFCQFPPLFSHFLPPLLPISCPFFSQFLPHFLDSSPFSPSSPPLLSVPTPFTPSSHLLSPIFYPIYFPFPAPTSPGFHSLLCWFASSFFSPSSRHLLLVPLLPPSLVPSLFSTGYCPLPPLHSQGRQPQLLFYKETVSCPAVLT